MKPVRTIALLASLLAAMLGAQVAMAHGDSTTDTSRCDTWYRPGHESDSDPATDDPQTHQGNSHHHSSSSDVAVAGTTVHGHSGHYAVRNQAAYVEVVGGQSYSGPPNGGYGQGGWAQGEVDPGVGQDADFHANLFGPVKPNASVTDLGNTGTQTCVTYGNNKFSTGQITLPTER